MAEPQAPGAAVAMGLPSTQLGPDPAYLTVELVTGSSSAVVPRYRARPVDVDGYLDFAVVQIYATSSGQPVNPASLHLPYLTVGSDSAVQLDQTVTVLGFPGVADSDTITVTPCPSLAIFAMSGDLSGPHSRSIGGRPWERSCV